MKGKTIRKNFLKFLKLPARLPLKPSEKRKKMSTVQIA